MKLSVYTGLVIGPMMIGAGVYILMAVLNDHAILSKQPEIALPLAAGFGIYGLYRLVRSIAGFRNRGEE